MNLSKSYEFFQPEKDNTRIHIIGCGSVGSTIADDLARCGITKMTFWDFDKVEEHNLVNQMFRRKDIGKSKVEALKEIILEINPEAEKDIRLKPDGWQGEIVSGYIFLAVDSIELRREIVKKHMDTPFVKAVFDVRTGLTDAEHRAADWSVPAEKENLFNSMQFSDEEADASTPVSACGRVLGVATTVRLISALAVNNYINFVKGNGHWEFVLMDGFKGKVDAF